MTTPMTTPNETLRIPTSVKLLPQGIEFGPNVEYDDWLSTVDGLYRLGTMTPWAIGDALNYGNQHYGEKYAQALALSSVIDKDPDTLRSYQWVAERVDPVRRSTSLSWSHHRLVSPLDPKAQTTLLTLAVENEWSVSEFKKKVAEFKAKLEAAEKGEPEPEPVTEDEMVREVGTDEEPPEGAEPELDPVAEWERAEAENEKLREQIESLQTDDVTAELAKLNARVAGLEGRLMQETQRAQAAVDQATYYQRRMKEIRDLLGVEKTDEIKPKLLELLQSRTTPKPAPKPKPEAPAETEAAPAPTKQETGLAIEVSHDDVKRTIREGATLVLAPLGGVHSGDYLRVVRIDVPGKTLGVAQWGDSERTEAGTVALRDLQWSQPKTAFVAEKVAWAGEVPA